MRQNPDPTCFQFPLRAPLLSATDLGTTVLAASEQKVCPTLALQMALCKLNQLRCLLCWLLFLLSVIGPLQLGHGQDELLSHQQMWTVYRFRLQRHHPIPSENESPTCKLLASLEDFPLKLL